MHLVWELQRVNLPFQLIEEVNSKKKKKKSLGSF